MTEDEVLVGDDEEVVEMDKNADGASSLESSLQCHTGNYTLKKGPEWSVYAVYILSHRKI